MSAYVIFDIEIRDLARYQEFMNGVKPAPKAWEQRYRGPIDGGLKSIRDECSTARLVSVEGLRSSAAPKPS